MKRPLRFYRFSGFPAAGDRLGFRIFGFGLGVLGFGFWALDFGFCNLKGLGLKFIGYNIKRSRHWVIAEDESCRGFTLRVMCLSGSLIDRGPLRD